MPQGNATLNEVPTTVGKVDAGWYNGRRAAHMTERVAITTLTSSATLTKKLPARCRLVWASIQYASTIAFAGADATATADRVALVNALPSGSVGASTSVILFGSTTLTTSGVTRDVPNVTKNTGSTEVTLYLVLADGGGSAYLNRNATAATSGLHFSGTANVDIGIYYETFEDTPLA